MVNLVIFTLAGPGMYVRRIVIADTYRAEEDAAIYQYYTGDMAQPYIYRCLPFTKKVSTSSLIATSCGLFCEACTYQKKIATV